MLRGFIRKSGEPLAQHPPVVIPSRPFPVQAKRKTAGPATLDEADQEARNTQSALVPGPSFRNISIFPQESSPNGTGSELPGPLRQKMERAFSSDFSDVRVHANTPNAKSLSALAFTQGKDIHFAPGQYNPTSQEGQRIIAHELAHVVQQRQGKVTVPEGGMPINSDPALEAEADTLGARAARGESVATHENNSISKSKPSISNATPVQPMFNFGGWFGGGGSGSPRVREERDELAATSSSAATVPPSTQARGAPASASADSGVAGLRSLPPLERGRYVLDSRTDEEHIRDVEGRRLLEAHDRLRGMGTAEREGLDRSRNVRTVTAHQDVGRGLETAGKVLEEEGRPRPRGGVLGRVAAAAPAALQVAGGVLQRVPPVDVHRSPPVPLVDAEMEREGKS